MAVWSDYPTNLTVKTAFDGTVYWVAYYITGNYTVAASFLTGEALRSLISEGVSFIRLVTLHHTTTAANEQSAIMPGFMTHSPWPAFESANTADGYQFYGPIGPLERPASGDDELIIVTDEYSEWSGNCLSKLYVYGKTIPLQYETATSTSYVQDVNVKKAEIWPWG